MTNPAYNCCGNDVFLKISPKLATKIGLNEAIVLQQIHYWLNPGYNTNYRDGRYWVYNTIPQWQLQFPFWSIDTIKKTLNSLEEKQLILRENLNPNKFARVLWYTIDYEKLATFQLGSSEECKMPPSQSANCPHRLEQNPPIEKCKLTPSKSVKSAHPLVQNAPIEEGKNRSSYIEAKNTTENTTDTLSPTSLNSTSQSETTSLNEREKNNKAQEMVDVFCKTVLDGKALKLNPTRIDQLSQVLTEQLDGKMENWQTLCQNITRSKFLMGESLKSSFKASLDWVLKDQNATKILEGNYGVGDREISIRRDLKTVTDIIDSQPEPELMKTLRRWFIRFFGLADYTSWFEQAEFVLFDENRLVLQVPSQFVKDWLGTNYLIDLRQYLKQEQQKAIQVEIVIAPKQSSQQAQVGEIIKEVTAHLTSHNPQPMRKELKQ